MKSLRSFLASAAVTGGTALVAAGSVGCEVSDCEGEDGSSAVCGETLALYEGDEITAAPLPYTRGTTLDVLGIYGDIEVVGGVSGEVGVTFQPFTYRGYTKEDEAQEELDTQFDYEFEESGGVMRIRTLRINGGDENLGAHITVSLPPEFDADLLVENESDGFLNPGDVDIDYTADAFAVEMRTESLGDCELSAAPNVFFTYANCDGEISIRGVSDGLDIYSRGLGGSVFVELADVGPGTPADNLIVTEDGDIDLLFPAFAAFSVQMQSTEDGFVSEGELPPECRVEVAAETSKSVACGELVAPPNYRATAGLDGVGPSSVYLSYY